MGAYINPTDTTKEKWLTENAIRKDFPPVNLKYLLPDYLPVVLVDNGSFTAAAIAYSQQELEAFLNVKDPRSKKWYLASVADLHTVSPELQHYLDTDN